MGFNIIYPKDCPKCDTEMSAQEIDDLSVLCGRKGIEYCCPNCHHTEFDGVQA